MLNYSELKCTHSAVLSKNGNHFVSVLFERGGDSAEGTVPDCAISHSIGFTEDEVRELEEYLMEHRQEIIESAKGITKITRWFS